MVKLWLWPFRNDNMNKISALEEFDIFWQVGFSYSLLEKNTSLLYSNIPSIGSQNTQTKVFFNQVSKIKKCYVKNLIMGFYKFKECGVRWKTRPLSDSEAKTMYKLNLQMCKLAKASSIKNWSIQLVRPAGLSSWSVQLICPAGPFIWSVQLVCAKLPKVAKRCKKLPKVAKSCQKLPKATSCH